MSIKLGLIGGGVMGEALLSRLITREIYQPEEVIVSEPQLARRTFFEQQYKVVTCQNSQQVIAESSEAVLLAIKPQVFKILCQELAETIDISSSPVIISIMAGVPLSQLELAFQGKPVIRAMPNTPATVGAAITAICPGANANAGHLKTAQHILQAVGEVVEVSENLMDAVTGLSGSGPAYVALFVEALADGGVAVGLPRTVAYQLALQTLIGTAQLLYESKIHPAELKDRVSSPGGTTIAGIGELERGAFRSIVIEAVKVATARSQELGK